MLLFNFVAYGQADLPSSTISGKGVTVTFTQNTNSPIATCEPVIVTYKICNNNSYSVTILFGVNTQNNPFQEVATDFPNSNMGSPIGLLGSYSTGSLVFSANECKEFYFSGVPAPSNVPGMVTSPAFFNTLVVNGASVPNIGGYTFSNLYKRFGLPNTVTNISSIGLTNLSGSVILDGIINIDVNTRLSDLSSVNGLSFIGTNFGNLFSGNIVMSDGASIEIQPNVKFETKSLNIQGCKQLWKGIKVNSGSSYIDTKTNIEDAEYAIRIKDGASQVGLLDTRLNNNYVGIYAAPSTVTNDVYLYVSASTFESTRCLKPHYNETNVAPTIYTDEYCAPGSGRPYAGMFLNDVSLARVVGAFPEFTYDPVRFKKLSFGIIANRTSLMVRIALFEDIKKGTGSLGGVAVKATGTNTELLSIDNSWCCSAGNASNPLEPIDHPYLNFKNCDVGID